MELADLFPEQLPQLWLFHGLLVKFPAKLARGNGLICGVMERLQVRMGQQLLCGLALPRIENLETEGICKKREGGSQLIEPSNRTRTPMLGWLDHIVDWMKVSAPKLDNFSTSFSMFPDVSKCWPDSKLLPSWRHTAPSLLIIGAPIVIKSKCTQ